MSSTDEAIEIIRADLADVSHAAHVISLLDHYARGPMGGGVGLPAEVQQNLAAKLQQQPGCIVFLAALGTRAVGVLVAFTGFSTFNAKPLLNIHDLAVHAEARGRGVGKALLARAEREASELGCCKLTLEVRSDNEVAMGLYEKVGFGPSDPSAEAMYFWAKLLK